MERKERIFGINRNVFFLGLVSFFNDFSAEMVQSVMPAFLTTVLGAPAIVVGAIEGTADALSSVLKFISGWLSDKIQKRKPLAVMGYAISVGIRPILAAVTSFWQVFFLRVVDRSGKGFRDAPRDALIAESVDRSELGKSFGFHRSMDTLGATVGPLVAFFLLSVLGGNYRGLFLFAFMIGLGAIFSFVFVKDAPRSKVVAEKKRPKFPPKADPPLAEIWQLFREHRKFVFVVLAIFVFALGTLPISLVLLKEKEIGSIATIPLMYFVYSLTFVLTATPLGRLADRVGERSVIAGGFLAAALAYAGLSQASTGYGTFSFFVILGLYSAATDGLVRVLAAKALPHELLGTGQGFMNMAIGFSSLGAGLIGGALWTLVNSSAALLYASTLSLIGLMVFLTMTAQSKNV